MVKFIIMLLTVVAVGTGATLLNLNLRSQSASIGMLFPQKEAEEGIRDAVPGMASWKVEQELQQAGVTETAAETLAETMTALIQDLYSVEHLSEYSDEAAQETGAVVEETASVSGASVPTEAAETTEARSDEEKALTSEENAAVYYHRLQEMDKKWSTILNAAAKEPLASQQSAAEMALEFWDDELNAIYQKLRNTLSEMDFSALRTEERAWIRSRDEAANAAATKENYSNSTQNLAYTRSLLQWTKERVYVLAEMYYGE